MAVSQYSPKPKNILCEIPTTANHISSGRFCWIHTIVWGWHIFMCEKKTSSISKSSTATINSILSKNGTHFGDNYIRYKVYKSVTYLTFGFEESPCKQILIISNFKKLEYLRQAWVVYLPNITISFFRNKTTRCRKTMAFWGEKLDDVVTHAQAEIWSEHGAMNHT